MPDEENAYSAMPGQFLFGSSARLDPSEVEDALREFVTTVLRWVEAETDPRVDQLRSNWDAIINATPEEVAFCRSAGHMGLDPYDLASWPDGLPELLETHLSSLDPEPIVSDFLSAVLPADTKPLWEWLTAIRSSIRLGGTQNQVPVALDLHGHAGQSGFEAAYRLRRKLGIDTKSKIKCIADVTGAMNLGKLTFREHNHMPSGLVRAAVGWHENEGPVMAGPIPTHPNGRRFVEARGLFHAVFMCQQGPRLITRAHDWDQQASRGFAAELLAPRQALLERLSSIDEDDRDSHIDKLASEYEVNTELVSRQLQNAEYHGTSVD